MDLTGAARIDSKRIYERFRYRCFKCGHDVSHDIHARSDPHAGNLDHTLPAKFLWPMTTANATLLCQRHNAEKAEKWPSEFYTDQELKRLVTWTGIPYAALTATPHYNPAALDKLHDADFVDGLLIKYAAYMNEMITIRNRILIATGFDMFAVSRKLSQAWIDRADHELQRTNPR